MVAVKGKMNRVTEDTGTRKTVGVEKTFKVYPENDRVKPRGRDTVSGLIRKSVPASHLSSQLTVADSKVNTGLKNLENKKKHESSAVINIGRRALADISNVRADALRNVSHDGMKPGKTKVKSTTYSQRSSAGTLGTGLRAASSSSSTKSVTEKLRVSLRRANDDNHSRTLQQVDKNDVKVFSDNLGTKIASRKSFNNISRKSEIPLPPTRNSLPVLKQEKKTSSSKKEHAENQGGSKEKYELSVKLKVGRRVLPLGSSSGSHLPRNHASDRFVKTVFGGQHKVETRASSRKVVKPIVKANVRISDSQTTTKSETIGAAASSKGKEEVLTSSMSERKDSLVPCEKTSQGELPSGCSNNSVPTASASDVAISRKSRRRKSYTSLLMKRSKLLKEHGEDTEQDLLPKIYDDCNQLEVAEYVDEIYQYYWVMEAHHQPQKNYMEMQKEITPQMRGILVNWLIEVHLKFDLMQETLYLMVTLLDQYLSLVSIKKNEMQLVGLTALLLASKYEDFWHPRVTDLISISAESYTRDQMLGMESAILRKLKFRLNAPTPYVFMLRFLRAAQSDKKFEHLAFYLIELSLVEYDALNFKPSLLCASAIYLTRCTLHMTPAWTPLLGKHAHYEESELRECAESILKFHRAARPGMLKVTYEKFMRADYSRVAAIKPLDKLPR